MKRLKDKKKKTKGAPDHGDDKALWKAVTETIEPLKGRETLFQEMEAFLDGAVASPPPPKRVPVRFQATPPPPPPKKPQPELAHGSQPGQFIRPQNLAIDEADRVDGMDALEEIERLAQNQRGLGRGR